ncbi:hypothetical protein [Planctomycetes bacterium Pla163]
MNHITTGKLVTALVAFVATSCGAFLLTDPKTPAPAEAAAAVAPQPESTVDDPHLTASYSTLHLSATVFDEFGQPYDGALAMRVEYKDANHSLMAKPIEWVTLGQLDAEFSLPNLADGKGIRIEAYQGTEAVSREVALFDSPTEGRGFERTARTEVVGGRMTLDLGTCHLAKPHHIATLTIGTTGETGPVDLLVRGDACDARELRFRTIEFALTAPTTITLYSWNPTDTWTFATRVDGIVSAPILLPRRSIAQIPFPQFATVEVTYSVATYPDVQHFVAFPLADYTPLVPQEAAGYPRHLESLARIDAVPYGSTGGSSTGTLLVPYLQPSTAYVIELWNLDALRAGAALTTVNATTGTAGSTVSVTIN